MKKITSKVIAYVIAFLMVATLIPAIPASAEEIGESEGYSVEINETNFPDPEFRKALENHWTQDEDGDPKVLTAEELKHMNSYYHNSDHEQNYKIKDLTGIHLLTGVERISISYSTYIKELPKLPPNLKEIDARSCNLVSLPELPEGCFGFF